MGDRRVSLPGFNEIARSLPKAPPTLHAGAMPQPIPFADRSPYRGSNSPSPHHSFTSGNGNYMLNRHQSSASYPQHPYSSPPEYKQVGASPGYGIPTSPVGSLNSKQVPIGSGNVQVAAQVFSDPIRQMGTPASLPNASFMHTPPPTAIPASSRYSPYHMPKGASVAMHVSTSSPPTKYNREVAESNAARGGPPANHYIHRSPPLTPQQHLHSQYTNGQTPVAGVVSPAHHHQQQQHPQQHVQQLPATVHTQHMQQQQQQQAQITHAAAHRSTHYHPPAPTSSSAVAYTPLPKQKQVARREPSVPDLMEEEEEDEALGYEDDIRNAAIEDGLGSSNGNGMMSTAKIRTIHKLAERRRRREMKNLFDSLRKNLPIDKTIRLSKWEVLKKAIEVISHQDAEIKLLRLHLDPARAMPPANPSGTQ
ncbi:hypothetical protein GGI15_000219 [Coemansia interrupta]|uniref:BHLH domain-containing protein n=1 Tax=Coemansia interrupta TaxID=1126814 RepID=A0A9W8LQ14_9FUNG|nr:hypothetical protein GGI15_000219 [Coemansia interrupta]